MSKERWNVASVISAAHTRTGRNLLWSESTMIKRLVSFRLAVAGLFTLAMTSLASIALAIDLDYERENRWAEQVLPSILVGDPVWIEQANGHKFLAIYTEAENSRGAIIVGHGRGWNPDWELYSVLRMKLADQGYNTLAIQLPVLGSGAKVGDYIPTYEDASERYQLSAEFLQEIGFEDIAIVSHSLGAAFLRRQGRRTDRGDRGLPRCRFSRRRAVSRKQCAVAASGTRSPLRAAEKQA
jgi:hypothetical protein